MGKKDIIGIYGGTFDPVHLGHVTVINSVYKKMGFEKVIIIPSYIPPHKLNGEVTDSFHRINMLELALKEYEHILISDIEVKRSGRSYTVLTIKELKSLYPDKDLSFVVGADMLLDLPNWYEAEELFGLCSFTAMGRPGYSEKDITEGINLLYNKYKADVTYVSVPQLDISSGMIRGMIAFGGDIRNLVDERVNRYIKENGLYK